LLRAGCNESAGKQGIILDRCGQRTHEFHARCGDDLADLVEADLDIAARNGGESLRPLLNAIVFGFISSAMPKRSSTPSI
jgi:hypothetical protein